MPRALQKLCRNGNATSVSIPRAMLHWLGWLPGQAVIVEITEDKSLIVRVPQQRDFGPVIPSRIVIDDSEIVKP